MFGNAYSPLKSETVTNFRQDRNNSITLAMSVAGETHRLNPPFSSTTGKKIHVIVYHALRSFFEEISDFHKNKNVKSDERTFKIQLLNSGKNYYEHEPVLFNLLKNNSLKEEVIFQKFLNNICGMNALVPENGMKIQHLFEDALKEIDEYSAFEDNWDGYRGKKFKLETISLAKNILNEIKTNLVVENLVPDEITPGPASDGSLALEILFKTKDLIFTILPDLTNEIIIYTNDSVINKETTIQYPSDLRIYFEWLRRG